MRGALIMLLVIMCASLYRRRKENPVLHSLFWLLAIVSVLLVVNDGFLIDKLKDNEQFATFALLLNLCLIPLISSFLLKVVMPDWLDIRKTLLLLAPTIVFTVLYAITRQRIMLISSMAYTAFISVVTFVLIMYISIRYDRHLKNNFSNIDNRTVSWVRNITCIFGGLYLLWGVTYLFKNLWIDSLYFISQIAVWILIYRFSIRHVTSFPIEEMFATLSKEEKPELRQTESVYDKLETRLNTYMNEQRPWLNPSLTLQDLAIALHTNRTYLSEYFNKKLHTTFYDYLNGFRVNHACEILKSEPFLSIIQVGEKSGFHSLSTFRRAFEKHRGCTPAKYSNWK